MASNSSNIEIMSLKEAAKQQIKRDIDQAKTHLENHVNTKGQVLDLDENCEYCHIHFEEQKILKKNDFS
jgi:hypothetical protein